MSSNTEKVAGALESVNDILSRLIPLVPNIMGLIGLFIRHPNVDPELRRQAIALMRERFTNVIVEADAWLDANGYNKDGTKKV